MMHFLVDEFSVYKYYAIGCFVIAVAGLIAYIIGQLKHKW
jgi:hypothetical protein